MGQRKEFIIESNNIEGEDTLKQQYIEAAKAALADKNYQPMTAII